MVGRRAEISVYIISAVCWAASSAQWLAVATCQNTPRFPKRRRPNEPAQGATADLCGLFEKELLLFGQHHLEAPDAQLALAHV